MKIENKANIGDTIFYLKKINRETCPICSGTGKISTGTAINPNLTQMLTGNVREYTCPECKGNGTVKVTGQPKYEVDFGTVITIDMNINSTSTNVAYRVIDSDGSNRTISDDKMYLNQEADEKECCFMNLERRMVPFECIQIPRSFENTILCNEKLMRRLDEWRSNRKFKTEIYVDEKSNFFDCYTYFLMYRMLDIFDIPVVIWPEEKKL